MNKSTECLEAVKNLPASHSDFGAQKFLEFLIFLRRIILKDAVLLEREHPNLDVFQHAIFQSEEFQNYAVQARGRIEGAEEPYAATVTSVVPVIGNAIISLQGEVRNVAATNRDIIGMQEGLSAGITTLTEQSKGIEDESKRQDVTTQEELRRLADQVSSSSQSSSSKIDRFCSWIGKFPQMDNEICKRFEAEIETKVATKVQLKIVDTNLGGIRQNQMQETEWKSTT